MNKSIWALLLSVGLFFSVSGDDFEDFIQVCAKLSSNYNTGVRTKGTRFDKEYQMHLEHMKALSLKIQPVIRNLGIGQDIDFTAIANELEQIYLGNQDHSGAKGSAKLHAHSVSPDGLLKILTEDVKALRKMEFTTENGGSIKSSLETKRRLLEFRRLVNFFRSNYGKVNRNMQKSDVSLNRIFQQRLNLMDSLASTLMLISRQKYPNAVPRYNLHQETSEIITNFKALAELKSKNVPRNRNRSNNRSRSRNSKSVGTRKIDGTNSSASLYAEINMSLRNISDQLQQWEQSGFQSDEPIVKQHGNDPKDSEPSKALTQGSRKTNYSAMTPKQLSDLLVKRRLEIIKNNRSMDGFDRTAERKFLLTLTRDHKRSYNEFLRDYQQQGYSSSQAIRSAILKIHTRIQMDEKSIPAKEMIRLLQALDKEEERSLEKNDVDFKLERAQRIKN